MYGFVEALIEILRGVIILGIGGALFHLFPKLLSTSLVKHIEHSYNSRIEELRGIISGHNTAFRSTVDYIIATQAQKMDRTFEAVEGLLKAIGHVEKHLGTPMTFQSLLDSPELEALFHRKVSPVALSYVG